MSYSFFEKYILIFRFFFVLIFFDLEIIKALFFVKQLFLKGSILNFKIIF
jgi:hypothetical protein